MIFKRNVETESEALTISFYCRGFILMSREGLSPALFLLFSRNIFHRWGEIYCYANFLLFSDKVFGEQMSMEVILLQGGTCTLWNKASICGRSCTDSARVLEKFSLKVRNPSSTTETFLSWQASKELYRVFKKVPYLKA